MGLSTDPTVGNKEVLCELPGGLCGAPLKQESHTCLGCGMVVCMALQFSILQNKWGCNFSFCRLTMKVQMA